MAPPLVVPFLSPSARAPRIRTERALLTSSGSVRLSDLALPSARARNYAPDLLSSCDPIPVARNESPTAGSYGSRGSGCRFLMGAGELLNPDQNRTVLTGLEQAEGCRREIWRAQLLQNELDVAMWRSRAERIGLLIASAFVELLVSLLSLWQSPEGGFRSDHRVPGLCVGS
jgi:hypothetical protein